MQPEAMISKKKKSIIDFWMRLSYNGFISQHSRKSPALIGIINEEESLMLYPRSQDKELSPELFLNPGSEYRGTPFWAWNCELQEEELLRQLDVMCMLN